MKKAYPVVMTQTENAVTVFVPDFNINTQGEDIPEAMETVRDAIGLMGIEMQNNREKLPKESDFADVQAYASSGEIVVWIDVDFLEYRRRYSEYAVRKNCSLPLWLNDEAERACLNFSAVLQEGLKKKLNITDR